MRRRPLSVTLIACLYIVTGAAGLVSHLTAPPFHADFFLSELVSLSALLSGVFLFRARNWARWLALTWIGFHVVLSAFHSLPEFAIHCLFFAVFGYFLFRPAVSSYFLGSQRQAA